MKKTEIKATLKLKPELNKGVKLKAGETKKNLTKLVNEGVK